MLVRLHHFFFPEKMLKCKTISLLKLFRELTESADSVKLQQGTRQLAAVSPSPEHPGHFKGVFGMPGRPMGGSSYLLVTGMSPYVFPARAVFLKHPRPNPCMEGLR